MSQFVTISLDSIFAPTSVMGKAILKGLNPGDNSRNPTHFVLCAQISVYIAWAEVREGYQQWCYLLTNFSAQICPIIWAKSIWKYVQLWQMEVEAFSTPVQILIVGISSRIKHCSKTVWEKQRNPRQTRPKSSYDFGNQDNFFFTYYQEM